MSYYPRTDQKSQFESIRNRLLEIKVQYEEVDLHLKEMNYLTSMNQVGLMHYIEKQNEFLRRSYDINDSFLELLASENFLTIQKAEDILKHWFIFNKHLEDNPTLKEEWDALCMGIKLTEDFEDDKKN